MREIKFRGYAVQKMVGSQWLYGFGVDPIEYAEEYAKEIGRKRDWYLYTDSGPIHVHEKSIEQYTGLKDKNGKEIYLNSDYVKLTVWHGEAQPYTTYHDGAFDISDYAPPTKYEYEGLVTETEFGAYKVDRFYLLNLEGADAYSFKIVGNIYENPELLIRHKS